MQPKNQRINFLVTQDELAMLDTLVERTGMTRSQWLRQAIRRGSAEGPAQIPPPKPKRARR